MGGARRISILFSPRTVASRGAPDALRGHDFSAPARSVRLSVAIGTLLSLVTGAGSAWADPPAGIGAPTVASATAVTGVTTEVAAGVGPIRPAFGVTADRHRAPRRAVAATPATGARSTPDASSAARRRPASDPLLARIARESAAAEAVAEQLTEARMVLDSLRGTATTAAAGLAAAEASTATAEDAAAVWTRKTFIAESNRPEGLVDDPRTTMLGRPELGTAVLDLEAAEARRRAAAAVADRAGAAVRTQRAQVAALEHDLAARGAALRRLRAARASALIEAQRRRDAAEAALASRYLRDADGAAGKAALSAVYFALAQRGKPYEWGAEGPDRFDCSGLVQTAYGTADVSLPRTARPQYRVSRPVSVTALLPGDLLFFATDHTDWNTIHHVGVYLGRGLMVHAPTTGDVVRVAPVWWSEFFAAGRIVPGRPGKHGKSVTIPGDRSGKPVRRPRPEHPRTAPSPTATAGPTASTDPATASPPVPGSSSKSASPTTTGSPTASGPTASGGRTAPSGRSVETERRSADAERGDSATARARAGSPERADAPRPGTAERADAARPGTAERASKRGRSARTKASAIPRTSLSAGPLIGRPERSASAGPTEPAGAAEPSQPRSPRSPAEPTSTSEADR